MFAGDEVYRPPPHRCRSLPPAAIFDLSLCTEALCCESCEMVLDDAEMAAAEGGAEARATRSRSRSRRCRGEQASFPPPMPLRSMFLRAERTEGRIVLTEIRIERPELFRAFREGGRLRLELIPPEDDEEEEMAAAAAAAAAEEEEEMAATATATPAQEEVEIGWEMRRRERFRRCHPAVGGNRTPLWWTHRFVTTA